MELINFNDIETQDELTDKLMKAGFSATQATISRDIKELKIIKVQTNGGKYKYSVGVFDDDQKSEAKFYNILNETIIKIHAAKNLVVIKTYPGMAQAAAAAVDAMNLMDIVGSVAGDDTILLVFEDDFRAIIIQDKLRKIVNK